MLTLFHSPRTRSVRVYWLLEELGVPYELRSLPFTTESLKNPEYLKINPHGKVPAIQDGDLTMFESGAMVQYLIEQYGDGRLAPAPGAPTRAAYLQWVHFGEASAMPPLSDMAQHMMFRPEADRIPAVAVEGRERAIAWLTTLNRELAGKSYLLGDEFSGADIMLGYAVLLTKWFGLLGDQFPNAAAYLARLEKRPALKKALS